MPKENSKKETADVTIEQPVNVVKQDWMDDLQICLTFLTRIPVTGGLVISNPSLAQSTRFFPVIGALIGLIGVITVEVADLIGIPFEASVLIALLSMVLITGGLHEEGFAQTADTIFKRVENRDQRLDLIKNSNVGAFGILALIFSITLKWAALNSFSLGGAAVGIFIMAVISTGGLPILMRYMPQAEKDNLSPWTEQPGFDKATISVVLALIVSIFAVGFWTTCAILIVLVVVTGLASWFLMRLFSGTTSHLLGALQQISEICIILTIAVLNNE